MAGARSRHRPPAGRGGTRVARTRRRGGRLPAGGRMRVLVAGGGAVARSTVMALLEAGHAVRLVSPEATETARLWARGVEPWPADLGRTRALEGVADGCEAVLQTGAVREP